MLILAALIIRTALCCDAGIVTGPNGVSAFATIAITATNGASGGNIVITNNLSGNFTLSQVVQTTNTIQPRGFGLSVYNNDAYTNANQPYIDYNGDSHVGCYTNVQGVYWMWDYFQGCWISNTSTNNTAWGTTVYQTALDHITDTWLPVNGGTAGTVRYYSILVISLNTNAPTTSGMTTNIQLSVGTARTNTLYFTNGVLKAVTNP